MAAVLATICDYKSRAGISKYLSNDPNTTLGQAEVMQMSVTLRSLRYL